MTVVLDFIDFVVVSARVVHQHHIVALQVESYVFCVERLRSVLFRAHLSVVGVIAGPLELHRRLAEALAQDTVDIREHLILYKHGLFVR